MDENPIEPGDQPGGTLTGATPGPAGGTAGACAPTRSATSARCSTRPRRCSPSREWTPRFGRSPAGRGSASAPSIATSRSARTWSWPSSGRKFDACADAAPGLAAEYEPGEALARWLRRYTGFIATKRGLAAALHSGDPAFDPLPAYFDQHLRPALRSLFDAAVAAGQVRADVEPNDLLRAVANLCLPADDAQSGHAQRMVDLLIDGLRRGAGG